jgi:acetyl-CoA acyltransferase 1
LNSTSKNGDDIVITLAVRTPHTKAKKGGFKDSSLEYIVYAILKEVKERAGIDPALVEDICFGNVSIVLLLFVSWSTNHTTPFSFVSQDS